MKTLTRRAAALVMTLGLALGVSAMTTGAHASEDTGWGQGVSADSVVD